ncbi:MAG: 2-amino-4-hydroxy-6-hydroxymethyldihydropteridine diphosphokinase [Flavobacteriaceae bacterium]|nr:2-amino-4-hydroxy-6-hydroxymethyldihydropteridine diphosphokinase [Flavobacteriaceae bacterium]|tara:strand:+ start:1017 stop:2147 length:1131 start_codon:yes stop_codon:yes gene_type:complete
MQNIYIALGSNMGDRLANLQQAVNRIDNEIGQVSRCSSVYEVPAVGFSGPIFLNACLVAESDKTPRAILKALQTIENKMGRKQVADGLYHNRPIDLDLIMVDDELVYSDELTVPHPRLQDRLFVLQPLCEIAPQKNVPNQNQTVSQLAKICNDTTKISPFREGIQRPAIHFLKQFNRICVEGTIGCGKTSFAKRIAEDLQAKLFLERFAENPFLPKFYDDADRYAFPLEMSFLADRFTQQRELSEQLNLFGQGIVSDYEVHKSLIFTQFTLSSEEFALYRTIFYNMMPDVQKPDLYILLKQTTPRLLANIKKRGRSYERTIDSEYLDKVRQGYQNFKRSHPDWNIVEIDLSGLDFVSNDSDYHEVVNQLRSALSTN